MLGKFAVVMADPPWDIHMEVNYQEVNKYNKYLWMFLHVAVHR